jgi:hypothetical protein
MSSVSNLQFPSFNYCGCGCGSRHQIAVRGSGRNSHFVAVWTRPRLRTSQRPCLPCCLAASLPRCLAASLPRLASRLLHPVNRQPLAACSTFRNRTQPRQPTLPRHDFAPLDASSSPSTYVMRGLHSNNHKVAKRRHSCNNYRRSLSKVAGFRLARCETEAHGRMTCVFRYQGRLTVLVTPSTAFT